MHRILQSARRTVQKAACEPSLYNHRFAPRRKKLLHCNLRCGCNLVGGVRARSSLTMVRTQMNNAAALKVESDAPAAAAAAPPAADEGDAPSSTALRLSLGIGASIHCRMLL